MLPEQWHHRQAAKYAQARMIVHVNVHFAGANDVEHIRHMLLFSGIGHEVRPHMRWSKRWRVNAGARTVF
jgi:hypothetical protein